MKVFLAGHTGMVGSAILQRLVDRGERILTRTDAEVDLTNQLAVRQFMQSQAPDVVIMAAGRTGGIADRAAHPADFMYQNMIMAANVVHQAHRAGVDRLIYIGASEVYPKAAGQPMKEPMLMTGRLDATNAPFGMAKLAGIALCDAYRAEHGRDYRCVTPTNLYGPGDDFDADRGHVVPGLLRRFHDAVQAGDDRLAIWGTGKPLRDFLYVDDLADAVLFVLDMAASDYVRAVDPTLGHLNIGTGRDVSIRDLCKVIAKVTGFSGRLTLDTTKPDGVQRKLLDSSRLDRLGWESKVMLEDGIRRTYDWFLTRPTG
ncbi:GDP-L-fucose synthase family protein [Pseudooceanicola onchidii]|uniref:GDP-L-fucose synthase family protein n=1 Tax=Pseudooceanicola onchidii TaxID=2562279 RepID=UPI0010AAB666|nr:GDP-L-fucose synthase [Pseudooceanicola onchidii]